MVLFPVSWLHLFLTVGAFGPLFPPPLALRYECSRSIEY